MTPETSAQIAAAIAAARGDAWRVESTREVGGGSISRAMVLEGAGTRYFVKLNRAALAPMFDAEADGLNALARCEAIRVPRVITQGTSNDTAFLVLEHLDLTPLRDPAAATRAGESLAALHRIAGEEYGWQRANFIGANPQDNTPHRTWPFFFAQRRLAPQLAMARRNGAPTRLFERGERLMEKSAAVFVDYRPQPSLLHGDLWSGNAAVDETGRLALFDPACYHGDREADLAMTELFGGFPERFYVAYRAAWPLAPGFEQRKTLYNLYHVLNHLNLFGGGYLRQAERMIESLIAEL